MMADKIYKLVFTKDDGSEEVVQFTAPQGEPGEPGQPGEPGNDYTLTEADKTEIAERAAEMVEVPETLPNPNVLSFTGAVNATYDGSAPLTVNIPEGGGGTGGGSGDGTSKAVQAITLTEEVDSVELKIPYEKLPVNVIYSFDLQGSDTITDTNYTSNNLSLNGASIFRDQKILPTKAQKESSARVGRCIVTIQVSVDAIYSTFAYINTTNGEFKNQVPAWHMHHEPENGEITMKFSTWAGAKLGTGSTFRMAVI